MLQLLILLSSLCITFLLATFKDSPFLNYEHYKSLGLPDFPEDSQLDRQPSYLEDFEEEPSQEDFDKPAQEEEPTGEVEEEGKEELKRQASLPKIEKPNEFFKTYNALPNDISEKIQNSFLLGLSRPLVKRKLNRDLDYITYSINLIDSNRRRQEQWDQRGQANQYMPRLLTMPHLAFQYDTLLRIKIVIQDALKDKKTMKEMTQDYYHTRFIDKEQTWTPFYRKNADFKLVFSYFGE